MLIEVSKDEVMLLHHIFEVVFMEVDYFIIFKD